MAFYNYYGQIDERDINIIMEDNCTRSDAIKHLKKGTEIFKIDEWLEYIVTDYGYYDGSEDQEIIADCETIEELKKLVYNERFIDSTTSAVDYEGQRYIISYCL